MRPVLFQWRGFTVFSYPAMLYVGLVFGVAAGNLAAHAMGVDAYRALLATLILLVPALMGARLIYVAQHWDRYRRNPRRIWNRSEGGATMYGGLLVAFPLSVPLLSAFHLPFGAFWDVAAFTMLVGMIFTRIGCLLNGCCAGRPSGTWLALRLPNLAGVWDKRFPVQFLESAWAVILLAFAIVLRRSIPFPGGLFLFVAGGYAAGRLVLESMREPEPGVRRITYGHLASLVMIVLSVVTLVTHWPK